MNTIKMFMICTGLEVVAEITAEDATSYVAAKPLVITPVPQGGDTYGLAFMPYSPADPEGSVRFAKANIVSETVEVPDNLQKAYISRTTNLDIVSTTDGLL